MDFKQLTRFKDIIVLDKRIEKCDDRDTFNISWGIDKNYQVGAAISIASILENNKQHDTPFTFHIISDVLDPDFVHLLTELAEQHKTVIKLYHIDAALYRHYPKRIFGPCRFIIDCSRSITSLNDWINCCTLMLTSLVKAH